MDRNLPNYLTIMRLAFIPIIVLSFYFENSKLAHQIGGIIFFIACVTDFLDGYLARKYNVESGFGKMFDPIADKVLVSCILMMLVKTGRANEIPCLLILARELIVAGVREFLAQIDVSVPVSNIGKIKTFIQMSALTMLIIGSKGSGLNFVDMIGNISLWAAAILTLFSGYSYFRACIKYF